MQLHQTEIDGVPAVWAETDGPLTAALTLRAGRADETLARLGLAHLVEHLALFSFGEDPDHNGSVDATRTVFHRTGDPEEIVDFFGELCPRLHALPIERIDTEKRTLRSEAAGRKPSVHDILADRRYGASTFGLSAYLEVGLPALTTVDLAAWADRYATRGNAVISFTGPPPSGLKLELPPGLRMPVPSPAAIVPATPAWFVGNVPGVALGMVVPRGYAAGLLSALLERRLRRLLRFEQGVSYSPWTWYERRDAEHAELVVMVDALAENFQAARDGLLQATTELATRPPDTAELDELRRESLEFYASARGSRTLVGSAAIDLLFSRPVEDADDIAAGRAAVTPDEIRRLAADALGTALACVPPGIDMPEPWVRLLDSSPTAIEGRSQRRTAKGATPEQRRFRLVTGDEGVSITNGELHTTVRFDSCAAALAWPDGRRELIGNDGIAVTIEPHLWQHGRAAIALVDARIAPDRKVLQPPRDPAQIPKRRIHVPTWVIGAALAVCLVLFVVAVTGRERFGSDVVGFIGAVAYVGGFVSLILLIGRGSEGLAMRWKRGRSRRP